MDHTAGATDALRTVRAIPFDLALLDLMDGGADGLLICRAIRRTSGVPVIVVTTVRIKTVRGVGYHLIAE